jgi:hypothetical protein
MPSGDEGTGLHAFDDLDPISTVSALNVMPEPDEPARIPVGVPRSTPPPPPRRLGSSPGMPPAPRGAAGRSVPPPPPLSGQSYEPPTAPPPPPIAFHDGAEEREEPGAEDDTRVVPTDDYPNDAETPGFAQAADNGSGFEEFDASETDAAGPADSSYHAAVDDSELLELSSTTVATNIDMDWDEEDVQTKLRDDADLDVLTGGAAAAVPLATGRPSPFPAIGTAPTLRASAIPEPSPYPGNPSPFAVPSVIAAVPNRPRDEWELEDEALTRVMDSRSFPPPTLPPGWGFHGSDSLAPASDRSTSLGTQRAADPRARLAWVGVAAVAVIGMAFGARALLMGAEPATVTLVTKPADAEVLVDGQPLAGGQSSPFTVQNLTAGQPHAITVRKTGYAEQTHHVSLEPGTVLALPSVELAPMRVDTGFALASVPAGAAIYVDNHKLDSTTPARITDLDPGLHVIRLEGGEGYQPWETQVALASGQVIELPTARLVAGAAGGSRAAARSSAAPVSRSSARSSRSAGNGRARPERASPPPREREREREPVAMAPKPIAGPPRVTGSSGTLRLNSRPWSQVYVDGRLIGNTPQMNLALSPGSHSIKLVNPQLGMSKTFKVKIQNGKVTTKIVELMEP